MNVDQAVKAPLTAIVATCTWRSSSLIDVGYGDPEKLFPRNPRLSFAEACQSL